MEALRALMQERWRRSPGSVASIRMLGDASDHPWSGLDAEAAFQAGMIEGAAAALDLTVAELFEELRLG